MEAAALFNSPKRQYVSNTCSCIAPYDLYIILLLHVRRENI